MIFNMSVIKLCREMKIGSLLTLSFLQTKFVSSLLRTQRGYTFHHPRRDRDTEL